MRYGVFVNKFLVADFPNGKVAEAIEEARSRGGEFYDFWTGDHHFPKGKSVLTKEGAMAYPETTMGRTQWKTTT